MIVTHFIVQEKFTSAYINFFKVCMSEYDNRFIIKEIKNSDYILNLINEEKVYKIKDGKTIRFQKKVTRSLEESDKIIISGASAWEIGFSILPLKYIKKTVIQFWGADFYNFKLSTRSLKKILKRDIAFYLFRNVSSLVFLISGEYEKFVEITSISKNYMIAPMPFDPLNHVDYSLYRGRSNESPYLNIMVGNSATKNNCHIDAFRKLTRFTNIRVYCPLSYGEREYKHEVIKTGKELFGENFIPIQQYMNQTEYLDFLSTMDIGVFNNDRQQAMGNILLLLGLGKKIFLRTSTSMWSDFFSQGYVIFPIDELESVTKEELSFFSPVARKQNITVCDMTDRNALTKEAWDNVLKS